MKLGIVGSEAAKFDKDTYPQALQTIENLIDEYSPKMIVSGGCHLGGIDLWAEDAADAHKLTKRIFRPRNLMWSTGYKLRNIQIADLSDLVVCITVKHLPAYYTGMKFPYCYHCKTEEHIKSGGCWTVKYAKSLGKEGRIIVIS